jgi:2'-5' RNA ligase
VSSWPAARKDSEMPSRQGDSAIVLRVPQAEAAVSAWRMMHDPSAAQGMPAHITVLYPFLAEEQLTDNVLGDLRALCADVASFNISFRRIARFPGVLYLAPEPDTIIRKLTADLVNLWPENPPYGGIFDEVVPHLTIGYGIDTAAEGNVQADILPQLPLTARCDAACLYVLDGRRWRIRQKLPFGDS